jgi:hypothetical protein
MNTYVVNYQQPVNPNCRVYKASGSAFSKSIQSGDKLLLSDEKGFVTYEAFQDGDVNNFDGKAGLCLAGLRKVTAYRIPTCDNKSGRPYNEISKVL